MEFLSSAALNMDNGCMKIKKIKINELDRYTTPVHLITYMLINVVVNAEFTEVCKCAEPYLF